VTSVGAIVLAAGRSSRFRAAGGSATTKLVEELGGRPIVRMAAEAALASRARPVIVVTGHARSSVEAALAGLEVERAHNPEFSRGLASSLRVGLAAMPADVAGALVLLGDMPWIEARLIDALIAGFLANPLALAAAPTHEGRRGNPVLLGRGLFDAALRLEGDGGARRLVDALEAGALVEIEAPGAGATIDIDTPGDLADARQGLGPKSKPSATKTKRAGTKAKPGGRKTKFSATKSKYKI
jgi:molybdenum cofactor cytidylyltransferase